MMPLPIDGYSDRSCPTCNRKKVRFGKRLCSMCEARRTRGKDAPFGHKTSNTQFNNSIEPREQISYLRSANRNLETQISALMKTIGEQKELAEQIKSAVVAASPFPRARWYASTKAGDRIVAVIKFSDWHIGEVIDVAETEGFGEYNFKIAQKRLFEILYSFLSWIATMRHGYTIDECVIFGEGDYISGDIHRELSVTNEFPVPVQTAKAGLLFGEAVALLSSHFKQVTVYQVGADNHGRLERKPQFKQKFQNSFSYLVHVIASTYLSNHKNVKIVEAPGIKLIAEVSGWKFLIEHGDTVKSWFGIPYYGLERSRAREATRRMGTALNFDYQSIAHWHLPALVSGNIIINGSLSGTSEFDHGCGRLAPPSQVAFLVSPAHGIFNFTPFRGY